MRPMLLMAAKRTLPVPIPAGDASHHPYARCRKEQGRRERTVLETFRASTVRNGDGRNTGADTMELPAAHLANCR